MALYSTQDSLAVLINKNPVVATHIGRFRGDVAAHTFERYEDEASTYIRPPEIEAYQRKLIDTLLDKRIAIGCLTAPFGYGKTSTAIGIWKASQERNLLAIPPFSCGSVSEMGQAIASAMAFQLQANQNAVNAIENAYQAYLVSSARRLAEQDVEQFNIDFDTALRSIEDKIDRGYLHIEASGTHLLSFLEQMTKIAIEAGYSGLLVIVDEFQQFLGNINKAIITNFRTLVWGLRTRSDVPFGLLITMDPDTERNLTERAGDILHRIKEDGLYLDFSSVYDREFPRQLWGRYAEIYGFAPESRYIVDRATLDSIGQICERSDLSNGPRTVIDLFQRIAAVYRNRKRAYSPIDLIDDFMTGEIRFDGDRGKIASLVTELTSYDYIKRVPERFQTLKLIAAFPRGCSREIADKYQLGSTYAQLADELRGEVLTSLPEGIALIDLQRVGKPQNKLNIILKKYWMQITEEEIIADRAVKLFAKYVIAPLFPPFRNVLSGWSPEESEFLLTPIGSYLQIYEGTFFEEYPLRRVCIQVSSSRDQVAPIDEYVDAHLVFIMQSAQMAPEVPVYDAKARILYLYVPITAAFNRSLPRDVRWVEDYLRPVVMTPGVMLSLLNYIDEQAPLIEGITEHEYQRIGDHHRKLRDFLTTMVLGQELFQELADFRIISRGEQALRDVLFAIFRTGYPHYRTLITSPQWKSQLETFTEALRTVPPLAARGLEILEDSKANIAGLFGMRNYAGFESQAKQYSMLLSLNSWTGDRGAIQFTRHPGEEFLLHAISLQKGLHEAEIYEEVRSRGYLSEEADFLLTFLSLRGYVQHDAETKFYKPSITLSLEELTHLAHELLRECDVLSGTSSDSELATVRLNVESILSGLDSNTPLMEVQIQLLQLQRRSHERRPALLQKSYENLKQLRSQLHQLAVELEKDLPDSHSGLMMDSHINGAKRTLTRSRTAMVRRLSGILNDISLQLEQLINPEDFRAIELLLDAQAEIQTKAHSALTDAEELLDSCHSHSAWVNLADQLHRQITYLPIIADLIDTTVLTREIDRVQSDIEEQFSTKGLKRLQQLYKVTNPRIEKLSEEIQTAVRMAELLAQQNLISQDGPDESSNALIDHRQWILDLVRDQKISLTDVILQSKLTPMEVLRLLRDLEATGELIVEISQGMNQ